MLVEQPLCTLLLIYSLLKAGPDSNVTKEVRQQLSFVNYINFFFLSLIIYVASQDGTKPILVATARGNRAAVETLFPLTVKIDSILKWTIDGILKYVQSEVSKQQVLRS